MRIKKITCIQLDGEFPDFGCGFVMPDYGMPLIGTILAHAGYDVKVYLEHVTPPQWDRILESDLICFSSFTSSAGKIFRLAEEIRSKRRIPTVIGGTHATYFPESCLDYCDYVVIGEGDETILELVAVLSNEQPLDQVRGIAYRAGDRVVRTAPRSGPATFDTIPDFSLIQGYRPMGLFDMVKRGRAPLVVVQASRGCPHKCTFCIVRTMFPAGYRVRDIHTVIQDMRDKRKYGKTLMFVDNDFTAVRSYAKKLLRRIIEEKFDFDISIFARVEIAEDNELLSLMKQAGVYDVFLGFESIQPETLAGYHKGQSQKEIIRAIETVDGMGFTVSGSFVFGADTDTLDTVTHTTRFAMEHPISKPHFFPIWGHYPEKHEGYQSIVPWYRSIFRGWGYCDGLFVTNFPLNIPPSRLQQAIIDAYRTTYSAARIMGSATRRNWTDVKEKIGIRYVWHYIEKGMRDYIPLLQEMEDGLYDAGHHLREDVLIERVMKDPTWTFQAGNRTIESLGLSPLELPIPETRNLSCATRRVSTMGRMN